MNLGFTFSNRKILSIVILLLCIFLSLSLSNIPFLVNNTMPVKEVTLEGMDNNDSKSVIKTLLNDKYIVSNKKKISAINDIIPLIEDKKLQTKMKNIINKKNTSDVTKIKNLKDLVSKK